MDVGLLTLSVWFEVVYDDYDAITVAWSLDNGPVHIQTVPHPDEAD